MLLNSAGAAVVSCLFSKMLDQGKFTSSSPGANWFADGLLLTTLQTYRQTDSEENDQISSHTSQVIHCRSAAKGGMHIRGG